jgi:hypothetical protein
MSVMRRNSIKADLFTDRGVAPERHDPDETASPLRVISFMSTFSLQELCRMHKCCSKQFGKNKVAPRLPLSEEELKKARRQLNGGEDVVPQTPLAKPFTPSKTFTPSVTPLRNNNFRRFPAIKEVPSPYTSPSKGVIGVRR